MELGKAIKILETHNQWRGGADIPQGSPEEIGIAIDVVLKEVTKLSGVVFAFCGCGEKVSLGYNDCCSYECWHKKYDS